MYNLFMKKVLIVANGRKNPAEFVRNLTKESDFVIGTDGGAEFLFENKIPFDAAIGDFDSIRNKKILKEFEKQGIEVVKFPRDKDFSDTELAMRFALKKGYSDFTFTNALGKRTDHLLFNISVMFSLLKRGKKCRIIEQNEEIYITNNALKIKTEKGCTASVYPLSQTAVIEDSSGLKYPLKNTRIKKSSTLTLSNVALKNEIRIKVKSGTVLLIVEKEV